MAVVNVNSIEYAHQIGPLQDNRMYWPTEGGKLRTFHFKLPAIAVASDVTSKLYLGKLSSGKVRILSYSSYLSCSAWGGGATLDIGIDAYTASDGKTAVVAGPTDVVSAKDVSGVLHGSVIGGSTSSIILDYFSSTGLTLLGTVGGAAMPIGATLEGILAYEIVQ